MPNAFDRDASAAMDTSRVGQQMEFDHPDLPFDFGDILDIWRKTIDDFVIPIFKDLTGIDLSSPQAFFLSLVTLIGNGGNAVAAFVKSIIQPLIDMIVNALTGGTGHIGNPIEMVQSLLSGIGNMVGTAIESANQAADIARQVMSYVVQVVQSIEDIPIFGDIFEAINSFAFWVLGWFGITKQSGLGGFDVSAVAYGVSHVFAMGPVAQIRQPVIARIVIPMQHFHALGARTDKGCHDKLMHLTVVRPSLTAEAHPQPATVIWPRREHPAGELDGAVYAPPPPACGCNPRQGPHPTLVGDFVAVVAGNWAPFLGHWFSSFVNSRRKSRFTCANTSGGIWAFICSRN